MSKQLIFIIVGVPIITIVVFFVMSRMARYNYSHKKIVDEMAQVEAELRLRRMK